MKFIFLDVDGVLNDHETLVKSNWDHMPNTSHFSPVLCERAKRIADETGALFVLSSTWRSLFERRVAMREFFGKLGFDPKTFVDMTPRGYPGLKFSEQIYRGREIQHWINQYPDRSEISHILILDDNSDMAHLTHRLVQTHTDIGLTEEHVAKSIKMLNTHDSTEIHLYYKFRGE